MLPIPDSNHLNFEPIENDSSIKVFKKRDDEAESGTSLKAHIGSGYRSGAFSAHHMQNGCRRLLLCVKHVDILYTLSHKYINTVTLMRIFNYTKFYFNVTTIEMHL